MHSRFLVLTVFAGLSIGVPAFAQSPKADAPASPTAAADGTKILDQARDAIIKVQALSYHATVAGEGALAGKVPAVTADVAAVRAEAGGWKLYTKGSSAGSDSGATEFEVGYDGVNARATRQKEKVVVERTVLDDSALAVFFSSQNARHPIAWEILATDPLNIGAAKPLFEGQTKVDGTLCDIVLIPGKSAAPEAKAEPKAEGGPDVDSGVRLFFAATDHLPRKIERLLTVANGPAQSRVLTMSEVKVDSAAAGAVFNLPVPEGFSVKASEGPKRTAKKGAGAGAKQEAAGPLAVGVAAPDFALKDANGKEHKLADYKGKVVFLDFWATWCGPCRQAMPGVQKLHEHFKGKPVEVLGVNMNEQEDPVKYMKDHKFTYGLLINGETIAPKYNVQGIPSFFIIGTDGKLLWSSVGYNPAHDQQIIDIIQKNLDDSKKDAKPIPGGEK